MILVQHLHLTFGFQASRTRVPNVRCAALVNVAEGGASANAVKWKEGLREVIGQNKSTDGKITYGGIAQQSSGWFGSHSVWVPPTMRPDKLADVMKSLTVEDLLAPGAVPPDTQLMTSEDVNAAAVPASRNQPQAVPLEGEVPKVGDDWKQSPLVGSPKESKQDKADRQNAANPGDETEFDMIRRQFNYGLPIDKHGRQVPMPQRRSVCLQIAAVFERAVFRQPRLLCRQG